MSRAAPPHWAALDGVRAVGVLAVMGYHVYEPGVLTGGYLGVDLFFVLSGFLITWGLVGEWDRARQVSMRRFYARRALRLLPAAAAVLCVALVLAVGTLHGELRRQTLTGVPWIAGYLGNWARATGASSLGILANLWSLAVEEQFYLLWPLLLLVALRRFGGAGRRHVLAAGVAAAALVEMAYREVLLHSGVSVERLVNGLDTHSDGLLVGCALALWLSSDAGRLARPSPAPALRVGAWGAVGVLAVCMWTGDGHSSFQWGYPLAAVSGAVLIASIILAPVPALVGVLGSGPAVWIGRRSYGLYLWSYPVYVGLPWPRTFTGWPRAGAEVACSFVVAAASYRLVESPFLRRKRRYAADRRSLDATPA